MRILPVLALLLAGCAGPHSADPTTCVTLPSYLSFDLPEKYFTGKKLIAKPAHAEVPDELPDDVGPQRLVIELSHPPRTSMKPGEPRYYYPSSSRITITPLHDGTGSKFAKAYPGLVANARKLKKFLKPRSPDTFLDVALANLPDEPWNDAAMALRAKLRLIETANVRGFRLLCYYRQGRAGYGATNAELTYNFQGISRDGRFYISARIAVRNPALPDSIDDPRAKSGETPDELSAERARVNAMADDSFEPPLSALDEMMESIVVK